MCIVASELVSPGGWRGCVMQLDDGPLGEVSLYKLLNRLGVSNEVCYMQ